MFGRKKDDETAAPEVEERAHREGAKNRPTPKRRDQEAARKRPLVQTDRKSARAADRAAELGAPHLVVGGGAKRFDGIRDEDYVKLGAALDKVSAETGVPAEYIVAIIGVETQFGRNMGSYKVLDALYTLAFGYPKRAPFFAGELAQLFALGKAEPQLDITQLKGSYAGAMGMGQFMPSSYRLWAKDGDGDGRRDLLTHKPDVFASIANYFVVHGWQRGQPVVARAEKDPNLPEWTPETVEPIHTLAAIEAKGYRPLRAQPVREGATVINFEGDAGREYWLGYGNFFVITRYNRSPMYSLAVHQLAQAIRAGADAR